MKLSALRLPAVGVVLGLSRAPAWSQPWHGHGWMWDSRWGWGGMIGGGLGMILFWGVIIILIVFAVRGLSGSSWRRDSAAQSEKTPLQILQERYARGEIDKEEYEERRKTLAG